MPELPEVERARRICESIAVGRTITRVWCDDDRIVFVDVVPGTMARRLRGRKVVAARRRGKQLWWELDEGPWPLFHLGMTGQFVAPQAGPLRLASSPKNLRHQWPPRFAKIRMWFSDGGEARDDQCAQIGPNSAAGRP